jgi:hypothetical protein
MRQIYSASKQGFYFRILDDLLAKKKIPKSCSMVLRMVLSRLYKTGLK